MLLQYKRLEHLWIWAPGSGCVCVFMCPKTESLNRYQGMTVPCKTQHGIENVGDRCLKVPVLRFKKLCCSQEAHIFHKQLAVVMQKCIFSFQFMCFLQTVVNCCWDISTYFVVCT